MRTDIWRHFDFILLGIMTVMIIFGVAMIRSAIAGNAELIELNVVGRQIIYASAGILVIIMVTFIDYHLWTTIGRVLYIMLFVLFAVIAAFGEAAYGATRWLDLVFFTIQPSELAKIAMIVMLADFFARHQQRIKDLRWVARSFLLAAGLLVPVLLQPDLSTSIVLGVIWFALLWATGLEWKHLALFAVLGLLLPFLVFPFLEDYQQQRIVTFAFPDPDARYGEEYNINQAQITIGSGGWFGLGYGQGSQTQLRYLKVRHIDFIFASIGEEFGFAGNMFVMALLFLLIWRILRAAKLAQDTFGALICFGVAALIAFQGIVNIGVNLNLLPVTGLTLPFVSYGGSSLLSLMLGIGLVQSVVTRHKGLEF